MRRSQTEKGSLASLASRALGWSFANNLTARLGTLPIGVLLARLLGPHAFGTFAVALVALMALLSFNDLGVSLAIVRWEGKPAEIAPTVATLSVASSLIIYGGCFLGAPAFASAMGAPAATGVIRVLALNVVVDGIVATPAALMQRSFRQDRKMIGDQVNNWLGVAVSVGLAWQGFGAMSLAIGRMTGAVAAGILFVVLSPEPLRFGFDRAKARALCRFGLPLAGSSIIVFAVTSMDQLVVGHMLGPLALGFYALAVNLSSWPINMFSLPVRSVAPAVFSRLQDDRAALRTGFLSAAGLLGSATLPICVLMSGAAVPLLGLVYGARWVPAAHALIWLAILSAFRILYELVYDFFVVLARSRVVLTVQMVWLAALVPALIAGTRYDGISGAALAEVAVAACVVLPCYLTELSKVGIRRRALAARLWLPVAGAAGVGCAAAVAARAIPGDFAALAAGGAVALVASGLLVYRMRPALAALRADLGQRAAAPAIAEARSAVTEPVPLRRSAAGPWTALHSAAFPMPLDAIDPLPAFRDITGPLPIYRESAWPLHVHRVSAGPLPIYQDTVASLRWDPACEGHPGRGRSAGPAQRADPGSRLPHRAGRHGYHGSGNALPGASQLSDPGPDDGVPANSARRGRHAL